MIHSAPQRNAATLRKVLAPFSVSHVIAIDSCSLLSRSFSLFFLFLDFIAISDCVFNNKNHYVLGHTGYQIIITILVISTLNANLRVATRVYDVEGGAIFSKNSTFVFFDGAAWIPRLRSPSPIIMKKKSEEICPLFRTVKPRTLPKNQDPLYRGGGGGGVSSITSIRSSLRAGSLSVLFARVSWREEWAEEKFAAKIVAHKFPKQVSLLAGYIRSGVRPYL